MCGARKYIRSDAFHYIAIRTMEKRRLRDVFSSFVRCLHDVKRDETYISQRRKEGRKYLLLIRENSPTWSLLQNFSSAGNNIERILLKKHITENGAIE